MRARNRRKRRAQWHQKCCQRPSPCAVRVSLEVDVSILGQWMKNIPHAREQLHQASVPKGETDHQVGSTQPPRPHVDQAQDEGGQGESGQAQGRRVGDATVLDLLVETWLELTSKGRQALFATGRVDMGERTISEASGGFGGLMLLVAHFAVAVGFLVIAFGGVAGEVGVGVSGHGDG